jgi:Aminotransferase class IV.
MSRLLETVKIRDGSVLNAAFHNERMNRSRKELFGLNDFIDLEAFITPPAHAGKVMKCRVVYSEHIHDITYAEYRKKAVRSLRLVHDDAVDYGHKYEDRKQLSLLLGRKGNADEILIVKNGCLTDVSYANIAFFDGRRWLTPAEPLLAGTKRALLVQQGLLIPEEMKASDLRLFSRAMLVNAFLDFEDRVEVDVCRIG